LIIKYSEGKFSQYKITKIGEKLSIRTGIAFFQKLRVKLRKKEDKQQRKQERKENSTGGGLESMMAYVNEFGEIMSEPPAKN
jgi:ribosomal protein S26